MQHIPRRRDNRQRCNAAMTQRRMVEEANCFYEHKRKYLSLQATTACRDKFLGHDNKEKVKISNRLIPGIMYFP